MKEKCGDTQAQKHCRCADTQAQKRCSCRGAQAVHWTQSAGTQEVFEAQCVGTQVRSWEQCVLYTGVTWVKLRTSLEIYLAVHVYQCCVLGFEVMSSF